ncbi:GroES-like protein [Serendipita vermifera]|nr:GroES-like protein [Serendipita vermifera]
MSAKTGKADVHTAAVLHGALDLRIEPRPLLSDANTQLPFGFAQVKIVSTTLCGSDLHYYLHGRNGTFQLQHPLVLGHESAGIVTALGPGVPPNSGLRIGTRVAVECGIPCFNKPPSDTSPSPTPSPTTTAPSSKAKVYCRHCAEARYNLCPRLRFCSSAKTHPHLDGTLQSYLVHPAALLHPLPAGMSFEMGALAEPLGVVVHAARRAGGVVVPNSLPGMSPTNTTTSSSALVSGIKPGSSVLVFGAGAVGLLACMLARAQGARKVVCVDVNEERLQFARDNGFVETVVNTAVLPRHPPPSPDLSPADQMSHKMVGAKKTADYILQKTGMVDPNPENVTGDEGFDVVFECSGAEICIQTGIYTARLGGKLLLVGMGTPNVAVPLSAAACREVDLIGVFRYANTYPASLALLASGALDGIEKMITHRYTLEQTAKAFETVKNGKDESGRLAVKVCVVNQ